MGFSSRICSIGENLYSMFRRNGTSAQCLTRAVENGRMPSLYLRNFEAIEKVKFLILMYYFANMKNLYII